jgi:uncharacterized membrane protein HdeD (DUF308 family)
MTGRMLDRSLLAGRSPDDILALVAGVALFFAPLLLGFGDSGTAAWIAPVLGPVIVAVAVKLLIAPADWGKWAYLGLGLLTLAAPWVLDFGATASALWTHLVLGAAVAAAGIRLLFVPSHPVEPDPHAT